jgi:mRNA interferase HigB
MRLLGRDKIEDFKRDNAGARSALDKWAKIVEESNWLNFADLKHKSKTTDYVKPFFIFNIGGNKYRLKAVVSFSLQQVNVLKIGTHADYEKWKL